MDASYIYCGMLANIVQTKGSLHFITHRDHANYHAVERRHVTPQSTGVLCLSLTLWGHNDFSIYLVPEGLLHNVLNKAVPLDSASSFRATLQSFYELSFGSTYLPGRWDNLLFFQQDLPVLGHFAVSSLKHKQTCGNCCLNSQLWACLSKRSQFAVSYFILTLYLFLFTEF